MIIEDGTKETGSHWHTSYHSHKPIITVDFDHTITLNCPACPNWDGTYKLQEGVREALEKLKETFDIVILSGGGNYILNYGKIIKEFLEAHNIPFDRIEDKKPPAVFMIDDRAIHHKGWPITLSEISQRMGKCQCLCGCEKQAEPMEDKCNFCLNYHTDSYFEGQ